MARKNARGGRRGPGGKRGNRPAPGGASSARTAVEERVPKSPVELPAQTTVGELAEILEVSNVDTIKSLMRIGVMATVNETIEFDVAAKVAASFGIGVLKPKDREESSASVQV
ncbi:MAG: translation initiation factor IF-2 N-terminal domain-containing protein, partial [Dehalococcoidia bacterium]